MARAVCSRKSVRCEGCSLPARWCICEALPRISLPPALTVLMHSIEARKPSSTGHLLRRLIPETRLEVVDLVGPPLPEEVEPEGRESWILHPIGDPAPQVSDPGLVRLVLLDGTWAQASAMIRRRTVRGRLIRIPTPEHSRFWLREQAGPGRVSTLEAVTASLRHLGLNEAAETLDDALEVHVLAGLLTRGFKQKAAEFRATSTRLHRFPGLLQRLQARERPDGFPRPPV
jgi:DTW domain-containing protein